jgi:hypothetical protein
LPNRRSSQPPSKEAIIAVATWGTNNRPYWLFDRLYWDGLVKIVLAAGKVTSTIPWTVPAA